MQEINTELIRTKLYILGHFKQNDLEDLKISTLHVLLYLEKKMGREGRKVAQSG